MEFKTFAWRKTDCVLRSVVILNIVRDENLERFASTIQKMLDGNPAILLGSGSSIPYGLPSMNDLSDAIKLTLSPKFSEEESWKSFLEELGKTNNLESALEKTQLKEEIHNDLLWCVWEKVTNNDHSAQNNFLTTNTTPELSHILNKFIQKSGATNIITTNYDRVIEYAIDYVDGKCCTGFSDGYIRRFNQFPCTNSKRSINLYKVHGSIDWFKRKEEQTLHSFRFFDVQKLKDKFVPQIVTPGNSKYKETHSDPFRTVIAKADEALRSSCGYLCIGYGFNDEHIQPIIIDENRNKKKPIVIITKEITSKITDLFLNNCSENCVVISEAKDNGSVVNFSNGDKLTFTENYWQINDFYKLWFE